QARTACGLAGCLGLTVLGNPCFARLPNQAGDLKEKEGEEHALPRTDKAWHPADVLAFVSGFVSGCP
ncbi:MAG: hypothetical protein K8E66_05250, partial [Phycisphaerales bacterium]|nr:hypothetical protein [Phycisphaerales bacterium]